MYIIGVTGAMGAGKSKVASFFKILGIPVHGADETVHTLLRKPAVLQEIQKRWPHAIQEGMVNRQVLVQQVFSSWDAVAQLEQLLHPQIRQHRRNFLRVCARQRRPLVVLDIPLLFEKKLVGSCDTVVVAATASFLQRQRLLKRKGMTPVLMAQILQHHLSAAQKRKKAHHTLYSGLHPGHLFRQVKHLAAHLVEMPALKWSAHWTGKPGKYKK